MQVYLGIDWSVKSHAIVFVNEKGAALAQTTITQSVTDFVRLDELRQSLGVSPAACVVGLESSHLLLLDWLWSHGYQQVYIVAPHVTHSRQATYRQSSARTDQRDAYLIANLLRTDRHLLIPWQPDQPATQQLRAQVDLRSQLVKDRVREQNQLQEVLMRYYPAVLNAFSLDTDIALAFVQHYPRPEAAAQLSWADFNAFAQQQGYARRYRTQAFTALHAHQPAALPAVVDAYAARATIMAQRLHQSRQTLKVVTKQMQRLYHAHADAFLYDSLPGVGPLLGPALLCKLGDHRARFPQPAVLQAVAGTAPVTVQSGQRRGVRFRRACDQQLRTTAQQWARCSLDASPWALAYFQNARQRGHSTSRALRGLANRWMAILWTLWQTQEAYDEDYHLQRIHQRRQPRH
jgi:transposase